MSNKNWIIWATETIEQAALEFGVTSGELIYRLMSKELTKEQMTRLIELQEEHKDE